MKNSSRSWNNLSPIQREERRLALLVVFSMAPFLLLLAELPIFISDVVISEFSVALLSILVPMVPLANRIKERSLRSWALATGFIGIFLSAYSLVLSRMQTEFRILSTDVATFDFKIAGMVFALAVCLNAIGLILGMHSRTPIDDADTTEP